MEAKVNKAGNYVLEVGPHTVILNPDTGRISLRSKARLHIARFNEISDSTNMVIDVVDFDKHTKKE